MYSLPVQVGLTKDHLHPSFWITDARTFGKTRLTFPAQEKIITLHKEITHDSLINHACKNNFNHRRYCYRQPNNNYYFVPSAILNMLV